MGSLSLMRRLTPAAVKQTVVFLSICLTLRPLAAIFPTSDRLEIRSRNQRQAKSCPDGFLATPTADCFDATMHHRVSVVLGEGEIMPCISVIGECPLAHIRPKNKNL